MSAWSRPAGVCGIIAGVVLAGCTLLGGPQDPPGTPLPPGASTIPATGDVPIQEMLTPSPTPFKTELVLCATHAPTRFYDTPDPVASALLQLVTVPPAIYGEDYLAEPGSLLSLPTLEDGSIRRNDDGSFSVRLAYRADLVWSDGQPIDPVSDPLLGLSLPASRFAPTFDVLESFPGDASLELRAVPGMEYPYVPSQPLLPFHLYTDGIDPAQFEAEGYIRLLRPSLGPYYLAEQTNGGGMVFAANPYYPGAQSLIPAVRFRVVADPTTLLNEVGVAGCDVILDASLTAAQLPDLIARQDQGTLRAHLTTDSVYERLIFNTAPDPFAAQIPYFADARVRQTVAYALDRAALSVQVFGGVSLVLDSWLPPDHWAYAGPSALQQYTFDPATAARFLDESGWADSDGDGVREYHGVGGSYGCQHGEWSIAEGTPFTPTLIYSDGDPLRAAIANQVQTNLAAVGIRVTLAPISSAQLLSLSGPLARRAFDLALLSGATRPDPGGISQFVGSDVFRHPLDQTVVHRWQLEDRWLTSEQLVETLALNNIPGPYNDFRGQNYAGWCDESADLLIVQANLVTTVTDRAGFYTQHQSLFADQLPFLPLFARPRIAASARYVCGVLPGPYDPLTWNIAAWYFDESRACAP